VLGSLVGMLCAHRCELSSFLEVCRSPDKLDLVKFIIDSFLQALVLSPNPVIGFFAWILDVSSYLTFNHREALDKLLSCPPCYLLLYDYKRSLLPGRQSRTLFAVDYHKTTLLDLLYSVHFMSTPASTTYSLRSNRHKLEKVEHFLERLVNRTLYKDPAAQRTGLGVKDVLQKFGH
jgi:hypothetical protein